MIPADLQALLWEVEQGHAPGHRFCQTCAALWPCPTTRLAAAVREMAKQQDNSEQLWRWCYRLTLVLAKRALDDANASREAPNDWPAGSEWNELVSSSHSVFLQQARDQAGISRDEFMRYLRGEMGDAFSLIATEEYDAALTPPEAT